MRLGGAHRRTGTRNEEFQTLHGADYDRDVAGRGDGVGRLFDGPHADPLIFRRGRLDGGRANMIFWGRRWSRRRSTVNEANSA